MKIGWTLNVVIMESGADKRCVQVVSWKQARVQKWSKKELLRHSAAAATNQVLEADQENSSLRFSESCGIINQEMKEPPLCSLVITLSKSQTSAKLPASIREATAADFERTARSIGKPTGARILFRTQRSKKYALELGYNQRTGWTCCLSGYAGGRAGLCGVYGGVRPAETPTLSKPREIHWDRCRTVGVRDSSFPSITATAVQFILKAKTSQLRKLVTICEITARSRSAGLTHSCC